MSEARVRVSLTERTIEIEGTELFVNAQLQKFGEAITASFASTTPGVAPAGAIDVSGIFRVTERGAVQITTSIPGRNRRQQMANAGRLLAYAEERIHGRRTVPLAEVITACKAQRCYDQSNLSSALRKERSAFVLGGRRRLRTLSLTDSGRREAETLVKMLAAPQKTPQSPKETL